MADAAQRDAPVLPKLTLVTETVLYHLRPWLVGGGGDIWLDEVLDDRIVLGFRAHGGMGPATADWLREVLELLWPGTATIIGLKDYTSETAGA